MTAEVLAFLGGDSRHIAIFEAVEGAILAAGESTMSVQKSQISWGNPLKFAFLSLRWNDLILTLGLGEHVEHPKIFQAVEPYPGRWTHHVRLSEAADVDGEVRNWLRAAYGFALAKKR